MPLRVPGNPFWPALRLQDEKKQRTEELKRKLKQAEDDLSAMAKLEAAQETTPLPEGHAEKKAGVVELKSQIETQLAEQDAEGTEPRMTLAVKDKDKLNLIVIGPEKSGKTSMASFLA